MRCLRCALDYGPGVRYCDRCGRTLSRTLNGTDAEEPEISSGHDTSFLYSTFSPPGDDQLPTVGAVRLRDYVTPQTESLARPLSEAQEDPPKSETPPRNGRVTAALPPAALLPGHATYPADGADALPADAVSVGLFEPSPDPAQHSLEELDPIEESAPEMPQTRRVALLGRVRDEPPMPGTDEHPELSMHSVLDHEFDTEPAYSRTKPLTIGLNDEEEATNAPHAARLPRVPRRSVPSRLRSPVLGLLLVAVLVAALGIVGYTRYSAYTRELRAARHLAGQQQYAGAIAGYQHAIAEWPMHGAASQEQPRTIVTATAVAAQATAVAIQQEAAVTAEADRESLYTAWQRLQQQNALQAGTTQ